MTELRLDLQGVYDRLCDISLMLKSVVLHTKHLTSIYIDQGALMSAKAMGYLAEMPALTSVTIKTAHGFETGALASLGRINALTSLTLEITNSSLNSSSTLCPATKLPPSELARLQASDEVGLAKCTGLVSLTVINITKSGPAAFRPVEALLQAIAGSVEPKLERLVLENMADMSASVLDLVAETSSVREVSFAGSSVGSSMDVAKLSLLGRLQMLNVAPQQPTAGVLSALAKGCKQLSRLAMGAVSVSPVALCMPGVIELQLLAVAPHSAVSGGSSIAKCAGAVSSLSVQVKPPLHLSGLSQVWPCLRRLKISGYALDATAVSEIGSVRDLESLKITGSPEAAVSAKLLLPLLSMPTLQQLQLLEMSDLTDAWISEAVRAIGTTAGATFATVRELQLGSAAVADAAGISSSIKGSSSSSDKAAPAAPPAYSDPNIFLTDKGLVRLFACPKLQKLSLVQLPGVTLAGIKALVRGSQTLQAIDVFGCPAVSAAPEETVAKVAVAFPGRAVNLMVH
eukprot:GHUV01034866.1.p1 GENE.GHUV01034866.1~~GHUV01034866.1.p1  ORF type:complete len:514 (+),score=188.39 GHUV01034866.1:836-2377(+)